MTDTAVEQWKTVDAGWGRRATEFATLLEPAAFREYLAMYHHLRLRPGDRLLDVACGSGLALEVAALMGAEVSGIDASPRLIAIANDRLPGGDLRTGDMAALPWADDSFDAVTSFRGLWATTVPAFAEARRVLRPGGRIAVTTWGHVKGSPGYWALSPFALATEKKVRGQAEMKALGKPGVGEQVLAGAGFIGVRRHSLRFVWEFPDPETYARMLASTGPAYEAIQAVGEAQFRRCCIETATAQLRDGLPLRAEIDCVGFTARVASRRRHGSLLGEAARSEAGEALAEDDREDLGFVTNVARLWQHDPDLLDRLFDLIVPTASAAGLSLAERAVATVVGAGLTGDTYCPLAWGEKLAQATTPELAADVVRGGDAGLDPRSTAVAAWTRRVVADPTSVTGTDVDVLLREGFDAAQVLRLTLFIALRVAFSTVNTALGARPEDEYLDHVCGPVREAWLDILG